MYIHISTVRPKLREDITTNLNISFSKEKRAGHTVYEADALQTELPR